MERFIEKYKDLTESERRAFSYINDNKAEITEMNVQGVAKKCLCSKTVIINMCQKLGFEGFSDLKYYLKAHKEEPKEHAGLGQLQYMILERVKKTMALSNADSLNKAAREIVQAKTVYLVARGTSKAAASYFEHLLLLTGLKCINITDYNLLATVAKKMAAHEVMVVMSLSGETKKALEAAGIAKARNGTVISLTGFSTNSLCRIADYNLFCSADTNDTGNDDVNSRLGMFVVVDLLTAMIEGCYSETVFKQR